MSQSLHAVETGDGQSVLLIHGWEMSSVAEKHDFEPVFTQTSGYRRIYVDLPGMGRTPANGIKDLDEMLSRLTHFVKSKIGDSRFLVGGSSCGAYLARALAHRFVHQVDGLLLRVPLIKPRNSERDLDAFEPIIKDDQVVQSIAAEDRALLGDVLVQTPAYVKMLKDRYAGLVEPSLEAADIQVLAAIREDDSRYCLRDDDRHQSKLDCPVVIICGRQDGVVGYRDSIKLLDQYPRASFAVLDRAGHDLPVDQTAAFEALVKDWLIRVEEWRGRPGT